MHSRRRAAAPPARAAGRAGLLLALAAAAATGAVVPATAAAGSPTVSVSDATLGRAVPADYAGLSIETANLCRLVSLAQGDPAFRTLVADLGPVTLRVGASTGDATTWSTSGAASCGWQATTVTPALVDAFFGFVGAVGASVSWQVPLRVYNPANAAAEAAYVATKPHLASIEIGNEPNLYPNAANTYPTILSHWQTIAADYHSDGAHAPLTGPSVAAAVSTWYVKDFLAAAGSQVSGLTMHFYAGRAGTTPPPTCPVMLGTLGRLRKVIVSTVATANAAHRPLVVNETNNYVHEGQPGVSNAYCSALWAADYLLSGLDLGLAGMDLHGPVNDTAGNARGLPEYYSPINADGTPAPEFYGLLFAHQLTGAGGHVVGAAARNAPGLDAHAVLGGDGKLRVALINTGATARAVTVQTAGSYRSGAAMALSAPALTSLGGVTLGGAAVAANGSWSPTGVRAVAVNGTASSVTVPPYSALEVTYSH